VLVNILAFSFCRPGADLIAFYRQRIFVGSQYFELPPCVSCAGRCKEAGEGEPAFTSFYALVIAGLASVPILNFVTPLFATAFMVRIYKGLARRSGPRLAVRPVA
jgi:CysZ protein